MVFKTLTSFPKGQKCQLCLTAKVDPEALGNICQTADVIVHYFCLLLASKIQQKGTDKQGILGFFSRDIKKEIKRGSTIVCNYCKKNGATVICSRENCHLNFHVPCAQQKGSLHQFFNQFKSFCEKHKPIQKIPATLKKRRDLECVLCCSHIKFNVRSHEDDPIWPTCCKPQALLHKRCLQHFATSSGYYFKCPFCSNKEEFHKGMKNFGIFIPEQEASWETEPNAYRELLERDISCDSVRCRCPRGRVYSVRNSKWFLEACVLCGASGRHRGCMSEKIMPETYECDVCAKVNKKFPNLVPTEDTPESSLLSDKGESNEIVQQPVEESISKNLSLECDDIVIISDSESESSEVEVIDEIPPPTVTKNVRKRQLPVRQEKRSGLKRQRLAEGGAETSSGMCLTVDEERSRSLLSQATDNPSFRANELTNSSLAREVNFRNRESMNKRKDNSPVLEGSSTILMIEKVCTLSACDQTEIDQLSAENSTSNEEENNQSRIQYVDLVSDNETDQVLVISDTDSESIASSLLDSDSSLLDLSEIPESEKSLLLENVSPPNNYAREFPRRTQVHKKRRKKKKQATQKKRKMSAKTTPNLKSNERSDETIGNEQINVSSNQENFESSISSEIADINIPSSSLLVNKSSEEESFRGFCCEEAEANNVSVGISAPVAVDDSKEANKTLSNNKKTVNSAQHMSGNHIFLYNMNVGDKSECFTSDSPNLINKVKNINCQITDVGETAHPKHADENIIETTSNPVVLNLLAKNDNNYNKSISNIVESLKSKNNNHSNATINSQQEECSKKCNIGDVICNTSPSELSKNIKNVSETNIDSDRKEVKAAPHQTSNEETTINNILIEEHSSKKNSNETSEIKSEPTVKKISKSDKTKRAYKNNNKLKIICSLALKQPFVDIIHSLSNINKAQHHKIKSCNNISSETDILPGGHDDPKINFRSKIESNEVGQEIFDIPTCQFFNVSYNSLDDSQSPKKSGLGLELHSPKSQSSGNCSEDHGVLGSSIHCANLPKEIQSSEMVLGPKSTSKNQADPVKRFTEVALNLHPIESSIDPSQAQIEMTSSKIASEIPMKAKPLENISEITSCTSHSKAVLQSSKSGISSKLDSYKANLESQLFSEHFKSHQNSMLENNSMVNSSPTRIALTKLESNLEIQPFKAISESGLESVSSELSNLLKDKANLKEQKIDTVKKSHINSSEELQSCKLKESTKSLKESNNPTESTPNIKKTKPHKIRSRREKSKYSSQSGKKLSNNDTSEDLSKFRYSKSKHLKQKQQTMVKPEVKIDLLLSKQSFMQDHTVHVSPSSKLNLSQEQSLSETHDDSVVLMKSNVSVKPENSEKLNSSTKVPKVHSCIETKYPSDESNLSICLDEKISKCFKNVAEANKLEKLTTLITKDEEKLSIEIENNLKEIDVPITLNTDVCCIKNQAHKIITKETDEDVFPSRDLKKQMSVEDSTVHSCIETKEKCKESRLSPALDLELDECSINLISADTQEIVRTEEKKFTVRIENNLKVVEDSIFMNDGGCFVSNKVDDKNIKNVMDDNNVNTSSGDSEITKQDWYKTCISDCSTCHNTAALRTKHNIMKNDSIYVCFYCKGRIINTPLGTSSSPVSSTCSCIENKNRLFINCTVEKHLKDSELCNNSKLSSKTSLIGSDLNSNYKNNKSPEKQPPSKDCFQIVGKEILESKSSLNLSDVLSSGKGNMDTQLKQNPIQSIPGFIEKCVDSPKVISEKIDSKIHSIANMNNDKSTETPIKNMVLQIHDKVDGEGAYELRGYYNEVFKVRIILKDTYGSSSNNGSSSLLSHVETFWVNNRKGLREQLKSRYFSENDKHLLIYTDVYGFRYSRLFIENIPENIDPRVVFETGGDISYYLEKLIRNHKTDIVIKPQIVLIVYGNTIIPNKDIFPLLKLASTLNNIKLVVTTVISQKPNILNFNKKLIYYSKRYGYHVWDITKIHFLTSIER